MKETASCCRSWTIVLNLVILRVSSLARMHYDYLSFNRGNSAALFFLHIRDYAVL